MTWKRSVSIAVVMCCLAITAAATTIRRLALDEVRDRAESVFTGHVVSSAPLAVTVMNGQLPATRYTIAVDEVLQGTPGGTTTVTYLRSSDAPSLTPGVRYLFFKTGQPNDTTVGWGQGLYRFESVTDAGGTSKTILVSADGEPLVMANGTLARGARVRVIGGRVLSDVATSNEPQDQFTAFNADGSAAPRVARAQKSTAASPVYATFDDIRRFVEAGHVHNR